MTPLAPLTAGHLRLFPTLIAYGAPQFPASALLVVYGFFPVYYTQSLGLDIGVATVLVLATRLWDVFTDPLVGILSDRLRLPLGRRKPWLLMALPLIVPAVIAVFFAAPGISPWILGVWTILLYLGWTMITLPLNAWGVDLSGQYHERSTIAAVREAIGLAGTLAALAILGLGAEGGRAGLASAFSQLGWALVALFIITALWAARAVPDRPNPAQNIGQGLGGLASLLDNRPLRRLAIAFLLNGFANGLPITLFVFFVQTVIQAPDLIALFILSYFLAGIAGVPIWVQISKRLGKHRTWCAAMTTAAVFFLPVAALGPGDVNLYLALAIVTGLCVGADFFLPPAIQADVIDKETVLSGQSRAGLYFSILGMIYKLAIALAGGFALGVLAIAGFDPGVGASNDRTAVLTLAFLYAFTPVILKLAAVALMWRFPIDEAEQARLRRRIEGESPA